MKFLVLLVIAVTVPAAVYLGAAIVSAAFPARGVEQTGAETEPPIFICASLVHADFVLPLADPLANWPSRFAELRMWNLNEEAYLAFGFGDLVLFRDTPEWSDLRVSTALAALAGWHDTALRVVAMRPPVADPDCVTLRINARSRLALIEHIAATVAENAGTSQVAKSGARPFEIYVLAKGTYGPLQTCNQWIADGLAKAGLPHARFSPFSFGVMWPLR